MFNGANLQRDAAVDQHLNVVLQAGVDDVVHVYSAFCRAFGPQRLMMEVGLTDLFMLGAKRCIDTHGQNVLLEWYTQENTTGCDFAATVLYKKQVGGAMELEDNIAQYHIFFQAKVAQRDRADRPYADFLYESSKTVDKQKFQNYQNILLYNWAQQHNGEAYYVIYASDGVYWVNAAHLKTFFLNAVPKPEPGRAAWSNVELCVMAWQALAKKSFLDARHSSYNPKPTYYSIGTADIRAKL
ncbi:hypothetical protein PQX77_006673 [Marasmius sp. AFHP31]|nr:hypothetical protein PQX77_006673 [Marasmius sp. AFHP31]